MVSIGHVAESIFSRLYARPSISSLEITFQPLSVSLIKSPFTGVFQPSEVAIETTPFSSAKLFLPIIFLKFKSGVYSKILGI